MAARKTIPSSFASIRVKDGPMGPPALTFPTSTPAGFPIESRGPSHHANLRSRLVYWMRFWKIRYLQADRAGKGKPCEDYPSSVIAASPPCGVSRIAVSNSRRVSQKRIAIATSFSPPFGLPRPKAMRRAWRRSLHRRFWREVGFNHHMVLFGGVWGRIFCEVHIASCGSIVPRIRPFSRFLGGCSGVFPWLVAVIPRNFQKEKFSPSG